MSTTTSVVTSQSFAKQFVLPALWIFVVPILSWLFFLHAQSTFDARLRTTILDNVRNDKKLTDEERAAWTNYFQNVSFSTHILHPDVAAEVDPQLRFNYATFRWMIRLSVISIVGGIGVFLFVGLCVWISMQSLLAQYRCLLISWQVLRIYTALQTIIARGRTRVGIRNVIKCRSVQEEPCADHRLAECCDRVRMPGRLAQMHR